MLPWTSLFKYLNLAFISLGYTPRSEIAGSLGCSLVSLKKLPKCFPEKLLHFTLPSTLHKGSKFSTSQHCYFLFFFNKNYSLSSGCEVVLICMFLMTNDVTSLTREIFSNVFWPLYMLTNIYLSTLPILSVLKKNFIVHFPLPLVPLYLTQPQQSATVVHVHESFAFLLNPSTP